MNIIPGLPIALFEDLQSEVLGLLSVTWTLTLPRILIFTQTGKAVKVVKVLPLFQFSQAFNFPTGLFSVPDDIFLKII